MPQKMLKQFPCRCRHCRARRTLPKHPDHYVIRKHARCFMCQRDALSVDWYRKNKEHQKNTCNCNGYWFPHRKGGGVWCVEHPTGPTDDDYRERYQSLSKMY